jgi:penicillin-binding protein 1B
VPALALGAFEVTPLDLARAYAPLANGGTRPGMLRAVRAVYGADGRELAPDEDPAATAVISPAEAYLMTSLLRGVVRSGTASAVQSLGLHGDVAGKTGTTNEARDAWFAGYSSRLVAVVWVGFDDNQVHGLTGSHAALPIWGRFMKQALDAYPAPAVPVPEGITVAKIDPTNGKLAVAGCPVVAEETFLTGTEPPPCDEHRGIGHEIQKQLETWWDRLRGWWRR